MYPIIKIKDDRIISIRRRHPWIFSGAVIFKEPCEDGDIVEVQSRKGQFLAIGYYQDSSIMIRVLSFEKTEIDELFWLKRIQESIDLRKIIGLPSSHTNAYRLMHGEGDGVPGLIIDIYAKAAVIQCHSIGIHLNIQKIADALEQLFGEDLEVIYDKSNSSLPEQYATKVNNIFLKGDQAVWEILENDHTFLIDLIDSQKTGFFLDQRDNRALLSNFADSKKVLNLYCYTGGFSIYALNSGASSVTSIDSSKKAMEMVDKNIQINKIKTEHHSIVADVNQYLKSIEAGYFDIIVVDPPAFAKSARKSHNAIQAYKRINKLAMEKLKPGGILFTFSCSQVIDQKLFYDTISSAAMETGFDSKVLFQLSQGPDHPVSLFHPQAKYLKGLVVRIGQFS